MLYLHEQRMQENLYMFTKKINRKTVLNMVSLHFQVLDSDPIKSKKYWSTY